MSHTLLVILAAIGTVVAMVAIVLVWRAMSAQSDEFSRDLLPIPDSPPTAHLLVNDGARRNAQEGVMTLYSWPANGALTQYSVGKDWPKPEPVSPLKGDVIVLRLNSPVMPATVQVSRAYPADLGKVRPLIIYSCHNRRTSPDSHHPCGMSIATSESGEESWEIEIPLPFPPGEYLLLASVAWSEFPEPGKPLRTQGQAGANWFFSIEKDG